jgi:hypothetical protein
MSRIFTFGCSFTQYGWPTWATMLAYDTGVEYYNYGMAGLGNVGIFHRMLEADLAHKFQENDKIYILWSSWSREDRVVGDNWQPRGSVLNHYADTYDKKFVKKYWDFNNDIVKNSTAIISANRLYGKNIEWQATAFPFFTDEENPNVQRMNRIAEFYKPHLPIMNLINCETKDCAFNGVHDSHPDMLGHLEIAKHLIQLAPGTVEIFTALQKDIERVVEKSFDKSVHGIIPKIERILLKDYPDVYKLGSNHGLGEYRSCS